MEGSILHSTRAWGLSDYGVIGVLWTKGAEEREVFSHWEALQSRCAGARRIFCVTQWLYGLQSFGQSGAWLLMKRRSSRTRLELRR